MPDPSSSTQSRIARRRLAQRPGDSAITPAAQDLLAQAIPRRAGVTWWLGLVLALGLAAIVAPAVTAERWLLGYRAGSVVEHQPAPFTVRAPMLAGYEHLRLHGGVVIARGELATRDQATLADAIADATPRGPVPALAVLGLAAVLAVLFSHHLRRSTKGRLVRVQVVSFAVLAVLAVAVKLVMLATAASALVVPVAVLAMVPTLVLDRTVGLATGVLAALVVALLGPFDVGLAILLLVQAATAGLVIPERPKRRWAAALGTGAVTTLCTTATYVLLTYLTTGGLPELGDPLHAAWLAAAIGPALAAVIAVPLVPVYQRLVGEITLGKLIALEDLGHPLLRQIAERSPGTWQHSLMMANMAEIAANAIGASGRLVRVGAYYHDLGKSLSPKYFIENLEAGETSPHDQLPPEVSCDAIFAHVSEGIVAARKAGLHERIVDFMHMHHGNGVLEYFWARCREQGNPHDFTIDDFRYPGHPPQSRETAILTICDAVEAASRTLKKPDPAAIDALVQRIVYGKLHLGQLDESGLSMADLRRISDSLRETIRHANHGRIEYPWQKADQDASASLAPVPHSGQTMPRLDSLDRKPDRDSAARPTAASTPTPVPMPDAGDSDAALAATADVKAAARTAALRVPHVEADADVDAGAGNAALRVPHAEAGDAARIRAGSARNAQPGSAASSAYAAYDAAVPDADTIALKPEDRLDRRDSERNLRRPSSPHVGDPAARDSERDLRRAGRPTERARPVRPDDAREDDATPTRDARRREDDAPAGRDARPRDAERLILPASTLPNGLAQRHDTGHNAGATLPDGMLAARDTAAATLDSLPASRDAGRSLPTLPDGTVPIRDVGATPIRPSGASAGRDVATLPDGIVPRAVTAPPVAPADDAASTHEGMGAARDLSAPVRRDAGFHAAAAPLDDEAAGPLDSAYPAAPSVSTHPAAPSAAARPAAQVAAARAAAPLPPPPDLIIPQLFTDPPARPAPTLPPSAPAVREPAGDSTRAAGPPPPVDLDNATTNPPPMRRGPGGQPPTAGDPAQLAAALANLVARVSAAPFGAAPAPDPQATSSAPGTGAGTASDAAITLPTMARTADLDSAVTAPRLASALPPRNDRGRPTTPPQPLSVPPLGSRAPGTLPRTSGLSEPRPRPPTPLREPGEPGDLAAAARRRASTSNAPLPHRPPARVEDDERATAVSLTSLHGDDRSRAAHDRRVADEFDASVTEPSLPVLAVGDAMRVDLPIRPRNRPPTAADSKPGRKPGWAGGLAARIDAALDSDEFGKDTPVVATAPAELRALLGHPDPTREVPVDELELLHRRAAQLAAEAAREADTASEPRRSPHPTAEVDPDDIEAAIEVAPPARKPTNVNAIGVARPKKPE